MRALVTALVSIVVVARAAPALEPRDVAAEHYRVGSARYAEGAYDSALTEFEAGYAAHASPAFLVNIGQCLRKLDRLDEAALAFRRFLDTRSGSARTRLDVWDALEDVLAELNRRVDARAADAALFRAYLAAPDPVGAGDTALRAQVRSALDDIVRELVRIDDSLVGGYGVARGLALPRVKLPERATASGPLAADRIRQRLATIAATSRPTATTTNQRSPRSAIQSHMVR